MAGIRVTVSGQDAGTRFQAAMNANLSAVARGVTGGARAAAAEIKRRGDADIKGAGNFGPRWTEGFKVDVKPSNGFLLNARIDVHHTIPYAHVFQTGATIKGKPELWIPLPFANVTVTAREFPGGLFRVDRKQGPPLLLSRIDKEPKYFGLPSVTIKKRFHLLEIVSDVMKRFDDFYNRNFKSGQ